LAARSYTAALPYHLIARLDGRAIAGYVRLDMGYFV